MTPGWYHWQLMALSAGEWRVVDQDRRGKDWRQQRAPVRGGYSYVLASVAVTAIKDERVDRLGPRLSAMAVRDEG